MTSVLSRAPLRIGLAGGGTDIKDFYEIYGGKTLSVAIDRYVYCKASISNDHNYFCSYDRSTKLMFLVQILQQNHYQALLNYIKNL